MKKITLRQISQWTLFSILILFWLKVLIIKDSFFDFEACCPFGGLQAITNFFVGGALACSMEGMQVVMGGALVLGTIVSSKLFCGYACPVGTVSENLGKLGNKFRLPQIKLGGLADICLRSLKYIILGITFYFTLESNELFCKKFDPFFATTSFFGEDVSTWMALIAISLLVIGAMFLKQFWCKFICPLGAISSTFKYFYIYVVFAAILILLKQVDVTLKLSIIIILTASIAYTLEIVGLKKAAGVQVLKITRDESLCIDCGICDKKCPQDIAVSKMQQVNHPDCNMCTECMGVCPHEEEAIGINGSTKFRWLPVLITVTLIMTGLILGSRITIPTIDISWGTNEEMERSAVFEMAGIKNIKCYGSSKTFVDKMKKVPGVTRAATYIKDHRVVVYYDSTKLNSEKVRRSLFTSQFFDVRTPDNEAEVHIADFYIENFFDELDVVFLANMVKEVNGIYSFKTNYGHPVKIRFYHAPSVKADSLKMIIENADLIYKTSEKSFSSKGLYTVRDIKTNDTIMSGLYLKSLSFPPFKRAFNGRSKYSSKELGYVVFPIKSYPKNQQLMPYLVSHLGKADPFIVGIKSMYKADGPIAVVFYVKGKTTPENVSKLMLQKEITVHYDNEITEKLPNPYSFELPNILTNKK